jgi:hypothetical protein
MPSAYLTLSRIGPWLHDNPRVVSLGASSRLCLWSTLLLLRHTRKGSAADRGGSEKRKASWSSYRDSSPTGHMLFTRPSGRCGAPIPPIRRSVDRAPGGSVPDTTPPAWPNGIGDHLLKLHQAAKDTLQRSAAGHAKEIGRLIQLDVDIMSREERLGGRPEARQLTDARRELGFAVYAVSCGLYVHAYAGLRLFLELGFASVYFSANELHRRRWVSDRSDFSWNKALDENEGVLTNSFVQEFNKEATADAALYARAAADCYRHCSQFVHGKLTATESLPEKLSYSSDVLSDWTNTAHKAAESVLYLLYCRYGEEFLADDDGKLGATLEMWFQHLLSVRKSLGLPFEQER